MEAGYIIWNMDPVLFRIGSLTVRWYSVFLLVGFYISYRLVGYIYDREGRSKDPLPSYALFVIGGLILGGRLMHCLAYEPEYYLKYPWDIIKPWRGVLGENARFVGYRGMSGHGSAIGIVLGIVINAVRTRTPMMWMIDRVALFGPLIGFFVRTGNFFNSEILGTPSDLPWAFLFTRANHTPRHPVQLYEAIAYLSIFIVSFDYYKRNAGKEKPGAFLGLVLILVYTARFVLEFFKAKQSDVETGMFLNMGHLLSIPFIIAGLILFFRPGRNKAKALILACVLGLLFAVPGLSTEPDTAFNNRFRRDIGGWIAGDATYSIALPDGRTLWLFGDTFLGEVNPDNSIKSGSEFIRNSAVIQDGDSLNTLHGGTSSDPSDFIPTQHPDSTWYWPEHGLVEDDTLRIFVAKFREADNGTPGFNFEHAGNDMALFTYPGLQFLHATPILASEVNGVLYGDRILVDTTHTYIYGRRSDPDYNIPYPHVARTLNGTVRDQNWKFHEGSGWSADPASTTRIHSFQVSQQYSVSTYRGKYILLTQDIWLSPEIFSFTAPTPAGPWSNQRLLYTTPETGEGMFTYNAYVHPQFDRNREMLVSYNVNGDFWSIFNNVEIYRPRFIRIPYMNLDYAFWPTGRQPSSEKDHSPVIYPNPAGDHSVIRFRLPQGGRVSVQITGIRGEIRIEEEAGPFGTGIHEIRLELSDLSPGVYFCTVNLPDERHTLPLLKQ